VLFYVLFVCKCVLPQGDNPIAVNKYIISNIYYKGVQIKDDMDGARKHVLAKSENNFGY
jgi:hypothetical protein